MYSDKVSSLSVSLLLAVTRDILARLACDTFT